MSVELFEQLHLAQELSSIWNIHRYDVFVAYVKLVLRVLFGILQLAFMVR